MRLFPAKGMGHVSTCKSLFPGQILAGKGGLRFGQVLRGEGEGASHPVARGKGPPGQPARRTAGEEPEDDPETGRPRPRPPEEPPLNPTARQAAQLAPPFATSPPVEAVTGSGALAAHARASLEGLLPSLVRRVAWSGDGRRGTVRLELGGGELAGGTLLIHSDSGRVAVHLSVPGGANVTQWRDRIAARLAARGLDVEEVEVQ